MNGQASLLGARGKTDASDRLLSADDPLAELQRNCGGTLPRTLAVPELLALVQRGCLLRLRIAREFTAFDGTDLVSGVVRIDPLDLYRGGGCDLLIESWQRSAMPDLSSREMAGRFDAIDRTIAEVSVRLDSEQRVQFVHTTAQDTPEFERALSEAPGSVWSEHLRFEGIEHSTPLHWRLLDGARCHLPGSSRGWRARLLPMGSTAMSPNGFELLLIADRPLDLGEADAPDTSQVQSPTALIGGTLAPVLRQPIARLIANAETIRARLAGPLRAEYSEYAGNIASAGQHLNGLLDDLADLEMVESEGFTTERQSVEIGDAARRAAGVLGVRARAKNIEFNLPIRADLPPAQGEFRRVLQILINLIDNAIAYSPENSCVTVVCGMGADREVVTVSVKDRGPGLSEEQAARVFDKFERLGRDNDGGTGLGLYISSRLAEAMGGALDVVNPDEEGARFRLTLPVFSEPVFSDG